MSSETFCFRSKQNKTNETQKPNPFPQKHSLRHARHASEEKLSFTKFSLKKRHSEQPYYKVPALRRIRSAIRRSKGKKKEKVKQTSEHSRSYVIIIVIINLCTDFHRPKVHFHIRCTSDVYSILWTRKQARQGKECPSKTVVPAPTR